MVLDVIEGRQRELAIHLVEDLARSRVLEASLLGDRDGLGGLFTNRLGGGGLGLSNSSLRLRSSFNCLVYGLSGNSVGHRGSVFAFVGKNGAILAKTRFLADFPKDFFGQKPRTAKTRKRLIFSAREQQCTYRRSTQSFVMSRVTDRERHEQMLKLKREEEEKIKKTQQQPAVPANKPAVISLNYEDFLVPKFKELPVEDPEDEPEDLDDGEDLMEDIETTDTPTNIVDDATKTSPKSKSPSKKRDHDSSFSSSQSEDSEETELVHKSKKLRITDAKEESLDGIKHYACTNCKKCDEFERGSDATTCRVCNCDLIHHLADEDEDDEDVDEWDDDDMSEASVNNNNE